jgi:hypothetical protein
MVASNAKEASRFNANNGRYEQSSFEVVGHNTTNAKLH